MARWRRPDERPPDRATGGRKRAKMRIVVTGGAGFIGSHLCDALLERGHEVTAVDNLLTGNAENVVHHQENPRFRLLVHDVTEPVDLPCDAVFHLASPASPVGYRTYSIETLRVHSLGTMHMLEMAARH